MGTLTLDDIDDRLAQSLKARARASRRSIEQEAMAILREAIGSSRLMPAQRAERALAIAALTPREQTTDGLTLLREERDL